MRPSSLSRAALFPLLCLACSDETERPPPPRDCNEPGCLAVQTPVGGGLSGGGAGAPNGSGGSDNGGSPPAGTLAGSVNMIIEPDLRQGPLDGDVQVRASGPGGGLVSVAADSGGSFRLEGVDPSPLLWVGVEGLSEEAQGLFMHTLQALDGTLEEFVELVVMRRSVMQPLVQSSFLGTPVELDPQRGHAIISFVTPNGQPVGGVQVLVPGDASARVAYDAGDIYSDLTLETSSRGAVAIVNAAAAEFPGNVVPVTADLRGQELDLNVRFARDGVTVIEVEIE